MGERREYQKCVALDFSPSGSTYHSPHIYTLLGDVLQAQRRESQSIGGCMQMVGWRLGTVALGVAVQFKRSGAAHAHCGKLLLQDGPEHRVDQLHTQLQEHRPSYNILDLIAGTDIEEMLRHA